MKQAEKRQYLYTDILIVAVSIAAAVFLVRIGATDALLSLSDGPRLVAIFLAGVFFTSIFTVAPATIVLGELALGGSLVPVVLVGALGSLVGDYLIFTFFKERVSSDVKRLLDCSRRDRFSQLFCSKAARSTFIFLGALVIASPLPDELGLALMGITRVSGKLFVLISYTFNAAGILLISLAARALV